ncbi:MAG: galactokinase [Saprospiraceae bacterium]|nr:galactokinase [Saprospiraceae bacterium]
MKNSILKEYNSRFKKAMVYVKSPGRANIIGEHTDYNHGLVLPFAIEQRIDLIIGQNKSGALRLFAKDLDEYVEWNANQLKFMDKGWSRYFINAMVALNLDLSVGVDVVFGGNLPQGGGVSSSSAITCGFIAGINFIFKLGLSDEEMIKLASQAENGIGLDGGIMDQTSIFKGVKGKALKIDFLDHTIEQYDMPTSEFSFYLLNSGQKHNLVETEYNQRRATCNKALKSLNKSNSTIHTFRDVSLDDIQTKLIDPIEQKRSIHIIQENERVKHVIGALRTKDYHKIGPLLLESHTSLSKLYEVSTQEIDYLVQRCQEESKILGSRIMGGGFGGCTICFTNGKLSKKEFNGIQKDYMIKTGLHLTILEISACQGIQCFPV